MPPRLSPRLSPGLPARPASREPAHSLDQPLNQPLGQQPTQISAQKTVQTNRTGSSAGPHSLPPAPPPLHSLAGDDVETPPADARAASGASSSTSNGASRAAFRRGYGLQRNAMAATLDPLAQLARVTADIPVVVRGFVTDPKLVGFQILTNYESTYWRALLGNDSWGLYEVLRSYCHQGNNVCRPSINLLMNVLGIKQRRVITGWTTLVKGKRYAYPGLIEQLQRGELLIAEVEEEGSQVRYLFHLNLTPGLLTPAQLALLPPILQTKHAELIQRHLDTLADLESRRRPAKVATQIRQVDLLEAETNQQQWGNVEETPITARRGQIGTGGRDVGRGNVANRAIFQPNDMHDYDSLAEDMVESKGADNLSREETNYDEGVTICNEGTTICHGEGDKLSPKQHPMNSTHLIICSTQDNNNNRDGGRELDRSWQEAEAADAAVVVAGSGSEANVTVTKEADAESQEAQDAVVAALMAHGVAEGVALRLAQKYRAARIYEKIDYLVYQLEATPGRVKKPRGWLRRAIEENYGAPDGYRSPAERAQDGVDWDLVERIKYAPLESLPLGFYYAEEVAAAWAVVYPDQPFPGFPPRRTLSPGLEEDGVEDGEADVQAAAEVLAAAAAVDDGAVDDVVVDVRVPENDLAGSSEASGKVTGAEGAGAPAPLLAAQASATQPPAAQAPVPHYLPPSPDGWKVPYPCSPLPDEPGPLLRAARQTRIQARYGTSDQERVAWNQARYDLHQFAPPQYLRLIVAAEVITLREDRLHLAVWTADHAVQMVQSGTLPGLTRMLRQALKRPLTLSCEVWDEQGPREAGV